MVADAQSRTTQTPDEFYAAVRPEYDALQREHFGKLKGMYRSYRETEEALRDASRPTQFLASSEKKGAALKLLVSAYRKLRKLPSEMDWEVARENAEYEARRRELDRQVATLLLETIHEKTRTQSHSPTNCIELVRAYRRVAEKLGCCYVLDRTRFKDGENGENGGNGHQARVPSAASHVAPLESYAEALRKLGQEQTPREKIIAAFGGNFDPGEETYPRGDEKYAAFLRELGDR
jgi:hypothetical protein